MLSAPPYVFTCTTPALIVRSIRCMPTRDEVYKEPDPTWADPTREEREAKCLVQELGELGYEVAVRVTAK